MYLYTTSGINGLLDTAALSLVFPNIKNIKPDPSRVEFTTITMYYTLYQDALAIGKNPTIIYSIWDDISNGYSILG